MTCSVKLLAYSQNPLTHVPLATFELRYWRAIHAELMTHRVFSRNAGSSRAIPVETFLEQVWHDPAGPIHWGVNQKGMQARAELVGWRRALAGGLWRTAAKAACGFAWCLMKLNVHKQVTNRLLEPFQYISVVLSSTEWDNFFELRCHKDAQPEIQELANAIRVELTFNQPIELQPGQWHLPYILLEEIEVWGGLADPSGVLRKASAARCARASYMTHGTDRIDIDKDLGLFRRLVGSRPLHASPTEHQATPVGDSFNRNFYGWRQQRVDIETGL